MIIAVGGCTRSQGQNYKEAHTIYMKMLRCKVMKNQSRQLSADSGGEVFVGSVVAQ